MVSEPGRKLTIFIVDDEFVVRDALSLFVKAIGLSVKCFESASDFLEHAESETLPEPACLISDVRMPRMSGFELVEKLRALGKRFPVIMTTGHGDDALKRRAEELGVVAFLEKPFRPAKLREILDTIQKGNAGEKGECDD